MKNIFSIRKLVSHFSRVSSRRLSIFLVSVFSILAFSTFATPVFAETATSSVTVYVRPQVSCTSTPSSASAGSRVTWSSTVLPAGQPYSYSWSVLPSGGTQVSPDSVSSTYIVDYPTANTYTATLTVRPKSVPVGEVDLYRTTTCSVTINPIAFNYSLSATPATLTIERGKTGSETIIRTLTGGVTQPVSLSVSGLPANTTSVSVPVSASPTNPPSSTSNSILTIITTGSTPLGSFPITVTGSPLSKTTNFVLTVTSTPVAPTCFLSAYPNPVPYNTKPTLTWGSVNADTSTGSGFSTANVLSGNALATLNQTAQYIYGVTCTNTIGNESKIVIVDVLPEKPSLSAPEPSASCAANGSPVDLKLTWSNAALATSYKIHRSPLPTNLTPGAPGSYGQLPVGSPADVTSPYYDLDLNAGTYYYQVEAVNAAGSSFSDPVSVTIPACSGFDFFMSASSGINVLPGDYGSTAIRANYVSGVAEPVFFSIVSGLPSGATLQSFNPTYCTPAGTNCASSLYINTTSQVTPGVYTITVRGTSQTTGISRDVTFNLSVTSAAQSFSVTCSASPSTFDVSGSRQVTWTAYPTGGVPPYVFYDWAGDYPLSDHIGESTPSVTITYPANTSLGFKNGYITVTDTAGNISPYTQCTTGATAYTNAVDFDISASPTTANMNCLGVDCVSNRVNVWVSSVVSGFNGDVAISASPSTITINSFAYPLTYDFFDKGTSNRTNIITPANYSRGVDMVISSSGNTIPSGTYSGAITITGVSGSLTHTKTIDLKVGTVRPIFQEF